MTTTLKRLSVFWLILAALVMAQNGVIYRELAWEELLEPAYRPDVLTKRFEQRIKGLKEGDPKIDAISDEIGKIFDTAPVDKSLEGAYVKLPGFIIPLEDGLGSVSEFLFVPDAGACIHVPPPPPNATILAYSKGGKKLAFTSSFEPYWIMGRIQVKKSKARNVGSEITIIDATIKAIPQEDGF